MKNAASFVKATIAGGFFVVLPVVLVILVLLETVDLLEGLMVPIAEQLPVDNLGGVEIAMILAVLLILLVCFAIGLILRTKLGSAAGRGMERILLSPLPGYVLLKNLTTRLSGTAAGHRFAPALVESSPGCREPAFIIEQTKSGDFVIFVPLAPMPNVGSVRLVRPDRIERIDAPFGSLVNCVMMWGVGADELLSGAVKNESRS